MPFGSLATTINGTLYFADLEYGHIDKMGAHGPQIVIRSLSGGARPQQSIQALGGIFFAANKLWFIAAGGIYRATLSGKNIVRVVSALGANNLDVLDNGSTIFYTTNVGVFEWTNRGGTKHVAGGGNDPPIHWQNGLPATDFRGIPHGFVALSSSRFDFTTTDNLLAIVRDGHLWMYTRNSLNFFNGEMTSRSNGTVYALCNWSMCKIEGSTYAPIFRIPTNTLPKHPLAGIFLDPIEIAAAPNGNFFVSFTNDSAPPIGGIYEMGRSGTLLRVLVQRRS